MRTSKYLRKATRAFICECCSQPISKGEEYIDFETVDYYSDNFVTFKHRRIHKQCDKAKARITKDQLPMAVQTCNVKYHLIGKLIFKNKWYLLVKDWNLDMYYKYRVVYDHNGNIIKPEDVEL